MKEMNCLLSSNDKTDRTKEIEQMLAKTGVCRLGSGEFYVKNLMMPENSMLIGNGAATKVILEDAEGEAYVVNLNSANSQNELKNVFARLLQMLLYEDISLKYIIFIFAFMLVGVMRADKRVLGVNKKLNNFLITF